MLLTIDVGNTQTVLGLYDPDTETGDGAAVGLVDHWRISTVHERTSDEYSVMVRSMLDTTDVDFDTEITGTAICSGYGDPHYTSFDGTVFDYQGKCRYILLASILNDDEIPFLVVAQNIPYGNGRVAVTEEIHIIVGDVVRK